MAASSQPSSSTSLVFTNPATPRKDTSNPHPYAIKTTSTGILTHSNSTHSASSASHHFIPSPPAKPKAKPSRPSGHRYSRSLNADQLPRPLPVPPNFSLPSPTKVDFDLEGAPSSGSEPRADTLPSQSAPPQLTETTEKLPDDPRLWTPSQLSTYLASSLRVTSGDLPVPVSHDVTAFVRNQKITGRRFLRLNESDLDKYGVNQRWQAALLNASRALRQDSLRGRIWNFPYSPNQQDFEYDNYSSSSSVSSASNNSSRRGSPTKRNGRVQDMVANIERRSSLDDDGRGPHRSVSPGKSNIMSLDRIESPSKSYSNLDAPSSTLSRDQPQSSIFRPQNTMIPGGTGVEEHEEQQYKKESRLLPYPPSPQLPLDYVPVASPLQPVAQGIPAFPPGLPHYGLESPPGTEFSTLVPLSPPQASAFPSGALPFSPQHTGTMTIQQSPGPSPQPTQSLDALYASALADGVRPLPFPPHVGQLYQAPMQGYEGVVNNDIIHNHNEAPTLVTLGGPAPHGGVPHVQVQEVQSKQLPQQVVPPQLSSPELTMPIHAPQPRDGRTGTESPTKLLEEKLEELFEPRPRSSRLRQPQQQSGTHSPSRPRSRVASLNAKSRVPSSSSIGPSPSLPFAGPNINNGNGGNGVQSHNNSHHTHTLSLPNNVGWGPNSTRTRVISLSRAHSHRLSGVEAWGESHRHVAAPPDEELHSHGMVAGGDEMIKEMESEEEVGIEALLEKEMPVLPLPLSSSMAAGAVGAAGHERRGSGSSGASVSHSRAGSLREPRSAVITVVEPLSARTKKDKAGAEGEEATMETLLAKAGDLHVQKNGKRRVSGAEAWEMVNRDTVKHLEDSGALASSFTSVASKRSVEDIFFSVPRAADVEEREEKLRKREAEVEEREKRVLKTEELQRNMSETRMRVEELRGRLEKAERRIQDEERNKGELAKAPQQAWPLDVVRKALSASRIPGMLGLSTWLGNYATSSSSSGSTAYDTTVTSSSKAPSHSQAKEKTTLIRRLARFGLSLSTYAVLFGIGMCVVMLKLLGRKPTVRFGGTGIGVRFGVDVVGGGARRLINSDN